MLHKKTRTYFRLQIAEIYLITTLLLISLIIFVDCSCPHLKPNKNVIVACHNGTQIDKRHLFKCNPTNSQVPVGTIAIYKCNKYFKQVSSTSRLNGGRMYCTDKGNWSNMRVFKEFHCELECGKQPAKLNSLISFGNKTNTQSWPWVATIFRRTNDRLLYTCGGSLIGQRMIITAAHCVRDVHIHPEFYAKKFITDIALIELMEPVILSESVLPVCLPFNYEQDELTVSPGNFGEFASFGIDKTGKPAPTLQFGKIPLVNRQSCHSILKRIPRSEQFCAGQAEGPNICKGDSGAGMVFRSFEHDEEKYTIHGIVSNTGRLQNGCAKIVVFAKVFEYIRWIQETILLSENSDRILYSAIQNTEIQQKPAKTLQIDPDAPEDNYNYPPSSIQQQQIPSICSSKSGDLCFPVYHQPKPQPPEAITEPIKTNNYNAKFNSNDVSIYTEAEQAVLVLFRASVQNILLEDYMYTDEYLIKWLRAKKLNNEDAKRFLQTNLKWRKANRMNEILTENLNSLYGIFIVPKSYWKVE